MPPTSLRVLVLAALTAPDLAAATPVRPSASAALMGEFLTHPGGLVGLHQPVARTPLGRGEGALLLSEELGGYAHPDNHVGLRLGAALAARYGAPTGPFVESALGLGVLHTFVDGAVYAPDAAGVPQPVADLGRPAWMPTLSVTGGWDLGRCSPFLRAEVFGQAPFQRTLLPHLAWLAGVRVAWPTGGAR